MEDDGEGREQAGQDDQKRVSSRELLLFLAPLTSAVIWETKNFMCVSRVWVSSAPNTP
jgi:hypothetical protein